MYIEEYKMFSNMNVLLTFPLFETEIFLVLTLNFDESNSVILDCVSVSVVSVSTSSRSKAWGLFLGAGLSETISTFTGVTVNCKRKKYLRSMLI